LVEREAGGTGAMVFKRSGASFPVVARRKLAQAIKGTTERGGGFTEVARRGELEPGGKELVIGGGLVGLEGPDGLGGKS